MAANTQIGAENNQTLVSIRPQARPSVTIEKDSEVGTIEQNTTTNVPPWVVLLLILGWMLPSPNEISNWVARLIRRKE